MESLCMGMLKVMVEWNGAKVNIMKDNSLKEKCQERDYIDTQMALFMKDNFRIIREMDMEKKFTVMDIFTKGIGKMMLGMVMENIS